MSRFQVESANGVVTVRFPSLLDKAAATEFQEQFKGWIMRSEDIYILDFAAVLKIDREFYRAMINLKSTLKSGSKYLFSVGMSAEHVNQARSDGMEGVFQPVKSVSEAISRVPRTTASPTTGSVNVDRSSVELLQTFLFATKKAVEVQCKRKTAAQSPYRKKGAIPGVAISGKMQLVSGENVGSFSLCLSKEAFIALYEGMFDERLTEITAESEDAAGEMVNIIYGLAKTELNKKGYKFGLARPEIVRGSVLEPNEKSNSNVSNSVVVPFAGESGQFHIEVEFKKRAS